MALHAERGILATTWEDIARRADVAVATVYRYFPSLDALVPACGEEVRRVTQPPRPERAEAATPARWRSGSPAWSASCAPSTSARRVTSRRRVGTRIRLPRSPVRW